VFVSSFDLARACASSNCCTCFRDHANVRKGQSYSPQIWGPLPVQMCSSLYPKTFHTLFTPLLALKSCLSQSVTRIQPHQYASSFHRVSISHLSRSGSSPLSSSVLNVPGSWIWVSLIKSGSILDSILSTSCYICTVFVHPSFCLKI